MAYEHGPQSPGRQHSDFWAPRPTTSYSVGFGSRRLALGWEGGCGSFAHKYRCRLHGAGLMRVRGRQWTEG